MPEDLKLSQIGSSPLPPPFRELHSPGVRKHCQIIFACYFRKSSIRDRLFAKTTYNLLGKSVVDTKITLTYFDELSAFVSYRHAGLPAAIVFSVAVNWANFVLFASHTV